MYVYVYIYYMYIKCHFRNKKGKEKSPSVNKCDFFPILWSVWMKVYSTYFIAPPIPQKKKDLTKLDSSRK